MSDIMKRIKKAGKEEGRDKERVETALRMIADKKLGDEDIAKYAQMPLEQVRSLRQNANL